MNIEPNSEFEFAIEELQISKACLLDALEIECSNAIVRARNPSNDWRTTARFLGMADGIEATKAIVEASIARQIQEIAVAIKDG